MKAIIKGIMSIFLVIILFLSTYIAYYNYNRVKFDRQIECKEIIQRELKETGKIMVLDGATRYKATQEVTKKLFGTPIEIGNKTLTLDLQFKYGYSVDMSGIEVDVSDYIMLTVDSKSVVLDYVYLDVDNSVVESSSSLLVKSYTTEKISEIQKACAQEVRDELFKNEDNMMRAKASLEQQLNLLVGKIAGRQAVIRYE